MNFIRRVNWLPVIVVVLVLAGLIATLAGQRYGVSLIIAALPFSMLEVARMSDKSHGPRK